MVETDIMVDGKVRIAQIETGITCLQRCVAALVWQTHVQIRPAGGTR